MQCRLAGGARNLWSKQPLAPPAEDVITWLEFLADLAMRPIVGQQDETKNWEYGLVFFLFTGISHSSPRENIRTLLYYIRGKHLGALNCILD